MSLIGRRFPALTKRQGQPRHWVILTDPELSEINTWFVWVEYGERNSVYRKPRPWNVHDLPDDLAAEAFDMIEPKKGGGE